ncbi:MAG: tetratricopeptide repeat protein [Treponema sp.]|jgi:tetratricopeptide (TPR) repeat protein|nr:tetratricopeptide repeat protein [Treponema sp.]
MKQRFFQSLPAFCLLFVFSACGGKPVPFTIAPRAAEGLSLLPPADLALGPGGFPLPFHGTGRPAYSVPSGDGGIVLFDAASNRELLRFYGFDNGEWLGFVPEGYYSASPRGASFFTVRAGEESYALNQFSELLRRPDLLAESLAGGGRPAGSAFAGPLKKNAAPPRVDFRLSPDLRTLEGGPVLEVKVSAEKGGAGMLALYRRGRLGQEIPAGLFDIAGTALRKYREGGRTCYDLVVYTLAEEDDSAVGVSAFNRAMTLESARSWLEFTPPAPLGATIKPALYALLAESGEETSPVEDLLLRQKAGALYSDVEILKLSGAEFGKTGFTQSLEELEAKISPADVFVLYLGGNAGVDKRGDLYFAAGDIRDKKGKESVGKQDIAAGLLRLKTHNTLLLLAAGNDGAAAFGVSGRGALDRLLERIGPRALFAAPARDLAAALAAAVKAAEEDGSGGPPRFAGASELASRIRNAAPAFYVSPPEKDFPLIGRNGYGESRDAELSGKSFSDVSFTYRPQSGPGDSGSPLPAFGVNFAELNPSGFRNFDPKVLTQMGMEQYSVSFLTGEQFYRDGEYDKAIAEYGKSLSLKADYAEAYIGRGNAYRKKGDPGRAIDDYGRALRFKPELSEVYNYRGYAYAERGDFARAIEDYSRALEIKNDYVDACFNRAYAFARQGDYDRAIDDYTRVLKLEPRNAAAFNQRGSAWYRKEDDDRAILDYSEALKIRPDYALAWHNRGNAWFNKGDYAKALADLNRAIRLQPASAEAYRSRGNIHLMMREPGRAEEDFKAAERLR